MHTFRHNTFRALFLFTAVMVVLLCALKTNVAYHSKIQTSKVTLSSHLSVNDLFNAESIDHIVHDTASTEEPCFVTKKLLTHSLPNMEDFTPILFLIALAAILFTRKPQRKATQRVDETPPKNRLHLTLCTFRE